TVIDHIRLRPPLFLFLNDPPPTVIYTLSLHDALPIWPVRRLIISTSGWMTSPSEPRRSPANPGRSFGHVAGRWNFSPAPVSAEDDANLASLRWSGHLPSPLRAPGGRRSGDVLVGAARPAFAADARAG